MTAEQTTTWPDLAIGLFEKLNAMNAQIGYEFVDMHVKIPSGTGAGAQHAEWVLNGTLNIRTSKLNQPPN